MCTTIVLLKFEQFCTLIQALEVEYIVDIGSAECVDALGVVAHHTDTSMFMRKQSDNTLLGIVSVLILVDKNISKPLGILAAHFGMVSEENVGEQKHIVEVDSIGIQTTLGINAIDVANTWHLRPKVTVTQLGIGYIGIGSDETVLCHSYTREHSRRLIHLVVELHLLYNRAYKTTRVRIVVNGKVRG